MLMLILRAKNSWQGEGEYRSRDDRYFFKFFWIKEQLHPKKLEKISSQ